MHRIALAVLAAIVVAGPAAAQSSSPATSPATHAADEAAIRAFIAKNETATASVREAPNLDWENAFGLRYSNVVKRDAFYGAVVAPLQAGDTGGTLEVRVAFVDPTVAVADEYWHEIGQRDVETRKPGPDRWGRTTYIFKKINGTWIEVIERVADLRLAYYRHYTTLPTPAKLPPGALTALAGTYQFPNRFTLTLTVNGDRFRVTTTSRAQTGTIVGIPMSPSTILIFRTDDLAEYHILSVAGRAAVLSVDGDNDPERGEKARR
jgi:hypothetical protein